MDNFILVELAALIGLVIYYGQKISGNLTNFVPRETIAATKAPQTPTREKVKIIKLLPENQHFVIREEYLDHPDITSGHIWETENLAIQHPDGSIQYTREEK